MWNIITWVYVVSATPLAVDFTAECRRNVCDLRATPDAARYEWDLGDGRIFNSESHLSSVPYSKRGTYTIALQVTDTNGWKHPPVRKTVESGG